MTKTLFSMLEYKSSFIVFILCTIFAIFSAIYVFSNGIYYGISIITNHMILNKLNVLIAVSGVLLSSAVGAVLWIVGCFVTLSYDHFLGYFVKVYKNYQQKRKKLNESS